MKQVPEIVTLINRKIREHKVEIEGASIELLNMRKDGQIQTAMKHMVLKDKMVFHKACIATLEDLLKDIES